MRVGCNRESKGAYFPCKLSITENNQFQVVYDHDGAAEIVDVKQLLLYY
jgi:hypothetical protein